MRKTKADSLCHQVAAVVVARGETTLDALAGDFPGLRRDQLQHALDNARKFGLIRLAKPGQGGRRGSRPGVWAGPVASPLPTVRPELRSRPPASAWELGRGAQVAEAWPPAFENARRYAPLGPWTEDETTHRSAD